MKKEYTIVNKRNIELLLHADLPTESDGNTPFVIAVHGLDSNYHEYGLYDSVAEKLAENGIACLRFDFPGNGESLEPFEHYTHRNMLDDMDEVLEFAVKELSLSGENFGVQGYSMGGRMTSLFTKRHPETKGISLWAPGMTHGLGIIRKFLGMEKEWTDVYHNVQKNGAFDYDPFGMHSLAFGAEFFSENRFCDPLGTLNEYTGNIFLAYGEMDVVASVVDMEAISIYSDHAKSLEILHFDDAGHDFGTAYGRGEQREDIKKELTERTVSYFTGLLK